MKVNVVLDFMQRDTVLAVLKEMSEIQIVQSMNESILNSITEFKNKKMKQSDDNDHI